eukprot:542958-Rhodomonas_salina.3
MVPSTLALRSAVYGCTHETCAPQCRTSGRFRTTFSHDSCDSPNLSSSSDPTTTSTRVPNLVCHSSLLAITFSNRCFASTSSRARSRQMTLARGNVERSSSRITEPRNPVAPVRKKVGGSGALESGSGSAVEVGAASAAVGSDDDDAVARVWVAAEPTSALEGATRKRKMVGAKMIGGMAPGQAVRCCSCQDPGAAQPLRSRERPRTTRTGGLRIQLSADLRRWCAARAGARGAL